MARVLLLKSPNMAVHSLSPAARSAAIKQVVDSAGFGPANPHLSAAATIAITNGQWPNEPVFTPYAITHHGYSQSKFLKLALFETSIDNTQVVRYNGTKYLLHRITYQSYYHDISPVLDISHILYLGINTAK